MKIRHWSMLNGSGMHRVAEAIAKAEVALGIDAKVVDCAAKTEAWDEADAADVHVVHTHLPDAVRFAKPRKIVYVAHGTPDHVFQSAVEAGEKGYGHADHFMLLQEWLKEADASVTFWPRHQWIFQRMVGPHRTIDYVPLGVDLAFWKTGETRGKFAGTPSVFTAENPHYIKWPYDLFVAWRDVFEATGGGARLHANYVVRDLWRWMFPLVNANGASYGAFVSATLFDADGLRNAFQSVDYVCGLVRYGDLNHMSLQANAAGATTISYCGNAHSDYWIHEGDQRTIAAELIAILKGQVEKRVKTPVPDIAETALGMRRVYERILDAPPKIIVPVDLPLSTVAAAERIAKKYTKAVA